MPAGGSGAPHVRLTPEGSRRIRVFRNGDVHHKGIMIVLNTRQLHTIGALLDAISEKIGLVLGCKRLYTLQGTPVTAMDQLEHNKDYVASSGPFVPAPYGQASGRSSLLGSSASASFRSSSNFSSSTGDPFGQSLDSKQALHARGHAPLRQSRSIEPKKGGASGRPPPSAPANGPMAANRRDRANAQQLKKQGIGSTKKKRKGSVKKKARDEPEPEEVAKPEEEPTHNGGEEEAEEQPPSPQRVTEVEVVEHPEEPEEAHDEEEERAQTTEDDHPTEEEEKKKDEEEEKEEHK